MGTIEPPAKIVKLQNRQEKEFIIINFSGKTITNCKMEIGNRSSNVVAASKSVSAGTDLSKFRIYNSGRSNKPY